MKYLQTVAYRTWKTPKPTKRVPEPFPKEVWKRGKYLSEDMVGTVKVMRIRDSGGVVRYVKELDVDAERNL